MLRVHIELYFPQLWRGAAIEPLVLDYGGLVVLRFEDLIPELYAGEVEVQTAEGFLILSCFVFRERKGDISDALFLHELAK